MADAPIPLGDYGYAFWPSVVQALLFALLAVAFVLAALVGLVDAGVWTPLGIRVAVMISAIPAGIMLAGAGLTLYQAVKGGPALRITDEGILLPTRARIARVISWGVRSEPDLIPWEAVRSVEPGPLGSVFIDYEGFEPSRLARWRRKGDAPRGRPLPLRALGRTGSDLRDRLIGWSEEKQLAAIRDHPPLSETT